MADGPDGLTICLQRDVDCVVGLWFSSRLSAFLSCARTTVMYTLIAMPPYSFLGLTLFKDTDTARNGTRSPCQLLPSRALAGEGCGEGRLRCDFDF